MQPTQLTTLSATQTNGLGARAAAHRFEVVDSRSDDCVGARQEHLQGLRFNVKTKISG